MENIEVNLVLKELADLLEIKGSNPFRIRAYRNAIRTIEGLTRSLSSMVEEGEDLTELPGIGKELAAHIREVLETGRLSALEQVGEEVPRSLVELIRLEGVGPKKARKLWEALGVTSVDEVEAAIRAGRVQGLEGFGEKSTEKILLAVEDFRKHQGRFRLSEADLLVAPLIEYMAGVPGVERVEVAGSYRRRKDTVGDLDLLVQCEAGGPEIMARFIAYPGARRVESSGDARGRILLSSGLPVDLRLIPGASWGAALHYFTGSKEHNVAIRTMAAKKGLRVNEYGVYETGEDDSDLPGSGRRLGGEEEEEVFRAVGLPFIPPLLRENRGEVEAAADGRLPRLVGLKDIRGDLHMHSTWSDGKASIRDMAEACRARGYAYLVMTDHSQAVTVARGLTPGRVRDQWAEIEEVRGQVEGIHLFRGLEVDLLKDGSLDMPDEILEDLDLVILSVHSFMGMEQAEMTHRVIRGLQHPQVDVLAHPTGRILNRREPFALDVDAVLQAAKEWDVAVEINAHPGRLDLHDVHVRRARELGVKVAINTDAHAVRHLDYMSYGVDQGRRGWLQRDDVLNAFSLGDFQSWIKREKRP